MSRIVRAGLAFGLVALMATAVSAQQPGTGRGPGQNRGPGAGMGMMAPSGASLLGIPAVVEELNIVEDQKGEVEAIVAEVRESRQGLRDLTPEQRLAKIEEINKAARAKVEKALKPEQLKRLDQIELQVKGVAAFADAKVKEALEFTEEQSQKIEALATEMREKSREAFQGAQGDFAAAREKFTAIQNETTEKVHAVLTDAQKTKWKELIGEKFEMPAFGAGRGPAGARPRGGAVN